MIIDGKEEEIAELVVEGLFIAIYRTALSYPPWSLSASCSLEKCNMVAFFRLPLFPPDLRIFSVHNVPHLCRLISTSHSLMLRQDTFICYGSYDESRLSSDDGISVLLVRLDASTDSVPSLSAT